MDVQAEGALVKLEQILTIAGREYPIVKIRCRLGLKQVGSGFITIRTPSPPDPGLLVLDAFYPASPRHEIFRGGIGDMVSSGRNYCDLFVRELSCAVDFDFRFHRRHITAQHLLRSICETTGLEVAVPDGAKWMDVQQPDFINMTDCRSALESAINIWHIQDGIWCQLPGGALYFGEYEKSPFFGDTVVDLSPKLIVKHIPDLKRIELPTLPRMRPGSRFHLNGRIWIVDQLEYGGATSKIGYL